MTPNPDMTREDLAAWLHARQWSDEMLARELGAPKSTVWRWRTGKREMPSYLWLVLWAIEAGALERPRRPR